MFLLLNFFWLYLSKKQMYIQDTFYSLKHLSIEEIKNLFYDAKRLSYRWFIDKHDERGERKRIKYARFDSILKLLNNKSHIVFIKRGGYSEYEKENSKNKFINHFIIETGFCTLGRNDGDYFLFINIDKKHLEYFIKKYKLYNVI